MKFIFENLGALEYAELDLADLTIICGENNTGKTYATYLIYCLLRTWRQLVDIDLEKEFIELERKGIVKIDLELKISASWQQICEETLKKFQENFPEMLASKKDLFSKLVVSLNIPLSTTWKDKEFKDELRSGDGTLLLTMTKLPNATELELVAPQFNGEYSVYALGNFVEDKLFNMLLEETIPNVFIASSERTGATTFRKQLNLATSNILDLLKQAHEDGGTESIHPNRVFETLYGKSEYALPIRHNVKFLNQLPSSNTEDGELHQQYPQLLERFEEIAGGTYVTNKEGLTHFKPKGSQLNLALGQVSSSVRSLLIVWYWLKHLAKKGDMLILDEPELNLHPANQRRLARFIVALINHGVKVFITTHSDYLIREFNTLIMLNQDSPKMNDIRQRFQDYKADDKLAFDKIALYMMREENILRPNNKRKTKTKTLVRADITPSLGIEVKTFDDTIDDMNKIQEAIYYGLE